MTRVALAAVLAVLAACGDNLPDPRLARSGARLKLGWWVYDDGTRQREATWYFDAELTTRCTPATWSDGHRYCGPDGDEAVYVNSGCTRALGRVPLGATPRPFFTTTFYLDGQPLPSRVFRAGPPATAPVGVWQKHDGGCYGPMPVGDFEYYELGTELAGEQLPRLRQGSPRGAGALAVIDELGDDGLRVPIGLYDRDRQIECTTLAGADTPRVECVPADSVVAAYFHDVECREPVAATAQGAATIARQYSDTTRCWRFYDLGEQVAAPPLYQAIGGACVSIAPPGGQAFYVMAGVAELPALERVRESSGGRLERIVRVHGDVRLEDPRVFDRELDTECTHDDYQRCAPATGAMVLPFFRDAQCAQPIELAIVPAGECDGDVRYARKGDDYHPLLAEHTGEIWVPSTGDTCSRYAPPEPFQAWVIGPALPSSRFAHAELQIDP